MVGSEEQCQHVQSRAMEAGSGAWAIGTQINSTASVFPNQHHGRTFSVRRGDFKTF